jgi:hypothetical protein
MKIQVYSPSLLPLMQTLSATLADIDFAYERELELLEERGGDPAPKERRRKALEQAHRERRAPYVQHLAELESRVGAGMPDLNAAAGPTSSRPSPILVFRVPTLFFQAVQFTKNPPAGTLFRSSAVGLRTRKTRREARITKSAHHASTSDQ